MISGKPVCSETSTDLDAVLSEQAIGAAGGEQGDAALGEFAGEVDDAGLVRDADQRAADRQGAGLRGLFGHESHSSISALAGGEGLGLKRDGEADQAPP